MVRVKYLAIEFIFLALALAFLVNASGVAYTWNGDIVMRPGETKIVNFNLQNMVGDSDVSFKVEIKNGSDIATLEKDEYLVKTKTYDILVPLTITIPQDAQEGSSRAIDVYFRAGAAAGGGTVSMGTGMRMPINVIIEKEKPIPSPEAEKPLEGKGNLIFIAVGIIVLLIIIVYLILRKRNK